MTRGTLSEDGRMARKIEAAFARARGTAPSRRRRLRAAGAAVPGARRTLHALRRRRSAAGKRLRPPRPPLAGGEKAARLSRAPAGEAFITGNGIAARCRFVLNYESLVVNEHVDNDWWFCHGDLLEHFFRELAPKDEYVLCSHNSDRLVGRSFRRRLEREPLVLWLAQNAALEHPKLRPLPIGIANPSWPHGDQEIFRSVQASRLPKRHLLDVSFDPETNPEERRYCLEQTGLAAGPRRPFPEYLEQLAASWFCVSPAGNGLDVHRTWEALYVGTIPVVTRSLLTEQHSRLPLVVLDDWSDFGAIDFSPELYARVWGDWSVDEIRLDRYLARLETEIAAARAS